MPAGNGKQPAGSRHGGTRLTATRATGYLQRYSNQRIMRRSPLPVLHGTLEFLALRTLADGRELHGFEILDWIHGTTADELSVEEGALYPALHRMEKRGWLAARWSVSEKGRRAKYYRLKAAGRRALASEERKWARYVAAVERLGTQGSGG